MKTRLLLTTGDGKFIETGWTKPPVKHDEISVRSIMTGVCRSDVDMMLGKFGPLPIEMSGHEGLGQVIETGSEAFARVGDYVATRGEPAYADYYNARNGEYVIVPAAEPKYILEPVACGVNLIESNLDEIFARTSLGRKRLLILGSGFLAWVAYCTAKLYRFNLDIDVVGHSNKELWGNKLSTAPTGTYDIIIDLSSYTYVFDKVIYNDNALIIMAAQKEVNTNFANFLWKAVKMVFPSPRNITFYRSMELACNWIKDGKMEVDSFWTKAYNRNTEWQKAFEDGANRPAGYNRGYIVWDQND